MKKIKCYFSDIFNLESDYHNFYDVKDKQGNKGTAFIFDKLTNNDIKNLHQWKNIIIQKVHKEYAPEIISTRVIVLEKCIKEKAV